MGTSRLRILVERRSISARGQLRWISLVEKLSGWQPAVKCPSGSPQNELGIGAWCRTTGQRWIFKVSGSGLGSTMTQQRLCGLKAEVPEYRYKVKRAGFSAWIPEASYAATHMAQSTKPCVGGHDSYEMVFAWRQPLLVLVIGALLGT